MNNVNKELIKSIKQDVNIVVKWVDFLSKDIFYLIKYVLILDIYEPLVLFKNKRRDSIKVYFNKIKNYTIKVLKHVRFNKNGTTD